MENLVDTAVPCVPRRLYVVRDTACGADTFEFTASHPGEALARLASIVVGTQRISFELYEVGHYVATESHLVLEETGRKYVCTASQAMLDSYVEEVQDLIDPKESPDEEFSN